MCDVTVAIGLYELATCLLPELRKHTKAKFKKKEEKLFAASLDMKEIMGCTHMHECFQMPVKPNITSVSFSSSQGLGLDLFWTKRSL